MLAAGALLGQARPADTNFATLFLATLGTEITRVVVCNTTGTAATFRLCHDQGGETYDESNALYWDKNVPANDSIEIKAEAQGSGLQMEGTDGLGIRSGTISALTFTAYGQTEQLALPHPQLRHQRGD